MSGNLTKRQHMAQGQGHDATRLQYDDLDRVTLCEQTGHNNQVFARSNYNDYDLANNLKSISREEDGNTGEMFEYDDANQLQSVSYGVDVVPRAPEEGGGVGVVAAVGKDEEREAVAALEADPGREPLAFLAAEPEPEAAVGPRTVTYTNDSINRLSMHVGATGQTTSYTPNLLNQYTAVTGQAAPAYDEKFNLSGYDGWTYVYNAEKRLISAAKAGHSAQSVYDGLGRCVKRTIDGAATVFTYDAWKTIVEWTGSGEFVAWNLYGPGADEILVRYQPNVGGHVHYHLDAQGNVQFLLSGEDHLGLEKYTYDVFGRPRITGWHGNVRAISSHGNRFLFTGREYLYTLGIYDYRHRYYHPGLGRFMQTDPLGLQIEGARLSAQQTAMYIGGTAPSTFASSELNLYRYCHNDPINNSDPLGLEDLNYFENGFFGVGREPLRKWVTRSPDDDVTFTVGGHGIEGGHAMFNAATDRLMGPRNLANNIRSKEADFKNANKVRLIMCEGGRGGPASFAQRLANELGNPVEAATKILWLRPDGSYFSADALPKQDPTSATERLRPDMNTREPIKIFYPKY